MMNSDWPYRKYSKGVAEQFYDEVLQAQKLLLCVHKNSVFAFELKTRIDFLWAYISDAQSSAPWC